jgi:homogentisate 1,2-dioxygenase
MSSAADASDATELAYMAGFGNYFETEAIPGSLPRGQNSPQVCAYGLYAEQLSGSAFTAPKGSNYKVWMYRIRPSVVQGAFTPLETGLNHDLTIDPNPMRWKPFEIKDARMDFVSGLRLICGCGSAASRNGLSIYVYTANANMGNRVMYNSDGDFLIVPQQGNILVTTELGKLYVKPKEIVVIPRGIKFSVDVEGPTRGYILEIYNSHFEIPHLGPIGANGLANARHFLSPVAAYVDNDEPHFLLNKYCGKFFIANLSHCPFDVVAWHGNYAPYKYDLTLFNTMNSVSFDHPDPSIYTVLTCTLGQGGGTLADFVIFPPRWMVMEHSFRPPYYVSRNISAFSYL